MREKAAKERPRKNIVRRKWYGVEKHQRKGQVGVGGEVED